MIGLRPGRGSRSRFLGECSYCYEGVVLADLWLGRHQQEALGFMLERETGHINERYRLWRRVVKDGSEE